MSFMALSYTPAMRSLKLLAAALALAALSPAVAQYKIINTAKVGGDGGFDYVTADSVGRRLYVSRSGAGSSLHVYNLDTLAPIGEVPVGSSHGAAVDPANHHGFATSKPVSMFDAETLKVIKTIDTGGSPDGYLLDAADHRFYVLSHSAPQVTVLDTANGDILGTVALSGAPEQSALDGKGRMYIDLEDKDAIAVVDTKTLKVITTYDIKSAGGGCAGLAMDEKNGILFASCRDKNNMIIVNAATGKILTTLPTGQGSDGAVFNPATMEAFSSQGDGTLTVVKESSPTGFAVEQTVKTPVRAKTLTLDTKTGNIFLITAEFGAAPAPVPGAPAGRPARPPMIPGSFEIVVVGK
jgi:sugar lactone lactonase YvrE